MNQQLLYRMQKQLHCRKYPCSFIVYVLEVRCPLYHQLTYQPFQFASMVYWRAGAHTHTIARAANKSHKLTYQSAICVYHPAAL